MTSLTDYIPINHYLMTIQEMVEETVTYSLIGMNEKI